MRIDLLIVFSFLSFNAIGAEPLPSKGAQNPRPAELSSFEKLVPWTLAAVSLVYIGCKAYSAYCHVVRHTQPIGDCAVCMEMMNLATSLAAPCGHRFHKNCVFKQLVQTFFDHNLQAAAEMFGAQAIQREESIAREVVASADVLQTSNILARNGATPELYFNRLTSVIATRMAPLVDRAALAIFSHVRARFTCALCRGSIVVGNFNNA